MFASSAVDIRRGTNVPKGVVNHVAKSRLAVVGLSATNSLRDRRSQRGNRRHVGSSGHTSWYWSERRRV